MYAGVGWMRADEGHERSQQGNARQKVWRQRGRIVRKELQRGQIDYEQQETDSSIEK